MTRQLPHDELFGYSSILVMWCQQWQTCVGEETSGLPVKPPPPSPQPRLLCSTKYSLSLSVTHNLKAFFSRISSGLSHILLMSWSFSSKSTWLTGTQHYTHSRRHLFLPVKIPPFPRRQEMLPELQGILGLQFLTWRRARGDSSRMPPDFQPIYVI